MRGRLGLLVAALFAASTAAAADQEGPRIRVEPSSVEFGEVQPGQTLRKELRVSNLGDQTLIIGRISKSCGCTEASVKEDSLAPGSSTPLLVVVKTPEFPGPIEQRVVVSSNDPKVPLLKLYLRAMVVDRTR